LSKVKLGENYLRAECNTLHGIQGHRVKYLNRNNSATDCLIAFKFDIKFHHITSQAIQCKCSRSKVKGQGYGLKGQGHSVMYQQQKCYNTAMDRFSDFKLGMTS